MKAIVIGIVILFTFLGFSQQHHSFVLDSLSTTITQCDTEPPKKKGYTTHPRKIQMIVFNIGFMLVLAFILEVFNRFKFKNTNL